MKQLPVKFVQATIKSTATLQTTAKRLGLRLSKKLAKAWAVIKKYIRKQYLQLRWSVKRFFTSPIRRQQAHKYRLAIMLVVSFTAVLLLVAGFQLKHSNDVLKSRNTRLQSLTQQLEKVNKQKATGEQELQDKAKAEKQLQDQINSLNTQLQAKLERQSIIARAAAIATATKQAYADSLSYGNDYAWGNCTWFVASVVRVPSNLGNANTWAYYASQDGFTVSNAPRQGAVAQTSAGYLGHVALVTAVSGNQVQVEEMNVRGLGVVDYRWVNTGDFVYIYFS